MRHFMVRKLWIHFLTMAVLLTGSLARAGEEAEPAPMPLRGSTLRLRFGLKDKKPTSWDGKIELPEGRIIRLRKDPPGTGKIDGDTWKLGTRWPADKKNQKKNQKKAEKKERELVRPGLMIDLDAPGEAKVSLRTQQGNFTFLLDELEVARPQTFLEGQVRIERLPFSTSLSKAPTEDDYPAATAGRDGTVWVAYVAYTQGPKLNAKEIHAKKQFDSLIPGGHGDQVRLLKFDGQAWNTPLDVTEARLDVWRPTIAVDGKGKVWVIWSQQVKGNWDLFARGYDSAGGRWGEIRRLTSDSGADVYAVAATHPHSGNIHLIWQGWRGGSFDILHTVIEEEGGMQEGWIFQSPSNEWCPSAAFDSAGSLHVAFDTYGRGNYDVTVVCGAYGPQRRIVEIANSPLHEAHASLVVDGKDRIWVAYEEAAANWGKDDGLRWFGRKGLRLYVWREIRVRCIEKGSVLQVPDAVPADPVEAGYPRGSVKPKRRLSLPRLAFDGAGRLWLLYRRHPAAVGEGERWVSYATYHAGDTWTPSFQLPNSLNLLDNRPALVAAGDAYLLAIQSSDGRSNGTPSAKQNDLYCSILCGKGEIQAPVLRKLPPPGERADPVHPNEKKDVRRIREYRAPVGGKTYRLLRGEFHRHTELTSHQDMDGTLEEMWRYGIDAASMDWIGNGDHHNGYGVEYLWWMVQKQTDIFHSPPHFLPMFTYERSVTYPSGHRNALFARRGIRPLPNSPGGKEPLYGTPEKGAPDIKNFYAYLRQFDGICASHTSGTDMGTDWRDNDPELEPVVEIFQGCRQSYEHKGAPATAKDEKDSIGGYKPAGYVWNALQRGYRLGFQSSSDHYSTHISYAIVYAEEPTREGILNAFKRRHCYAANDNIILDVRCGDRMMGDVFDLGENPTLTIRAIGTQPIARVSVVRGAGRDVPRYVYDTEPGKQEVTITWTDQSPQWGKTNYYYVRIEQIRPKEGAGAIAWGSPLWINLARKERNY